MEQYISIKLFAETGGGGLSALGLNVQSFLFQLITFVLVLAILRRYVFGRLVSTLEERRKAVEESLNNAAAAADELHKTEAHIAEMMKQARVQADDIVAVAHKEAAVMVEEAEVKARKRADHLVNEARQQLDQDVAKARQAIRRDTVQLVAAATERLMGEKMDSTRDAALIERAIKDAK